MICFYLVDLISVAAPNMVISISICSKPRACDDLQVRLFERLLSIGENI
jgi:hypothetical protein